MRANKVHAYWQLRSVDSYQKAQSARLRRALCAFRNQRLEVDFRSDLYVAWNVISAYLTKGFIIHISHNQVWAAVIKRVEGLQPKLQRGPFAESYVLEQGRIPALETRSQHHSGSRGAEVSYRIGESCSIEVFARSLGAGS